MRGGRGGRKTDDLCRSDIESMSDLIFIDFEWNMHYKCSECYPIEVAYTVCDKDTMVQKACLDTLIRPYYRRGGLVKHCINVHKIDYMQAMEEGMSIEDVIDRMIEDFSGGYALVGHNLVTSEVKILLALAEKFGRPELARLVKGMTHICTMKMARALQMKKLSLTDIHIELLGEDFSNKHRASGDVEATMDVYIMLLKRIKEQESGEGEREGEGEEAKGEDGAAGGGGGTADD